MPSKTADADARFELQQARKRKALSFGTMVLVTVAVVPLVLSLLAPAL